MSILDRLREQTRAGHAAIERDLDWERRVAEPSHYRDLLIRLYGFHAAWESAASLLIADDAFTAPRRKTPLLAADLAWLGVPDPAAVASGEPGVKMASAAAAFGAMYVLEGSTLGGQLIARRVAATLGFGPGHGCSYYGCYGAQTGAMWRDFRARLLLEAAVEGAEAPMLDAARHTFRQLRSWLTAAAPGSDNHCSYPGRQTRYDLVGDLD